MTKPKFKKGQRVFVIYCYGSLLSIDILKRTIQEIRVYPGRPTTYCFLINEDVGLCEINKSYQIEEFIDVDFKKIKRKSIEYLADNFSQINLEYKEIYDESIARINSYKPENFEQ